MVRQYRDVAQFCAHVAAVLAALSVALGYIWLWAYAHTLSPSIASLVVTVWEGKIGVIVTIGGIIVALLAVVLGLPGFIVSQISPKGPRFGLGAWLFFLLLGIITALARSSIVVLWVCAIAVFVIAISVALAPSLNRNRPDFQRFATLVAAFAAAVFLWFPALLIVSSLLPVQPTGYQFDAVAVLWFVLLAIFNSLMATTKKWMTVVPYVAIVLLLLSFYSHTVLAIPFRSIGISEFDIEISPPPTDVAFSTFRARCDLSATLERSGGHTYRAFRIHVLFSTGTLYAVSCGSSITWLAVPANGTWLQWTSMG